MSSQVRWEFDRIKKEQVHLVMLEAYLEFAPALAHSVL